MTTSTPVDIGTLIVCRKGVRGGRPCMEGTRFPVSSIAIMFNHGMGASDILSDYPHLDPQRVYAALAYYFANKAAVDADIDESEKEYDELAAKYPNGWPRAPAWTNPRPCSFAAEAQRVLYNCNQADFARIHARWAAAGRHHSGIVLSSQRFPVGIQIRALLRLVEHSHEPAAMLDRLEFLSDWVRR